MVTIHYARWVILDKDRVPGIDGPHVLFTSNFDGPLEGYLEDFAAVDEGPLNLVFGHCIGLARGQTRGRLYQVCEGASTPSECLLRQLPQGDGERSQ